MQKNGGIVKFLRFLGCNELVFCGRVYGIVTGNGVNSNILFLSEHTAV